MNTTEENKPTESQLLNDESQDESNESTNAASPKGSDDDINRVVNAFAKALQVLKPVK